MRLSEAIRLGAMLRPQGFGEMFVDIGGGVLGSCAFGAAQEAVMNVRIDGPSTPDALVGEVYDIYSDLIAQWSGCPVCGRYTQVEEVVEHLNDWHRWSRERIADWVEQIEAARAVPDQAETRAAVHA